MFNDANCCRYLGTLITSSISLRPIRNFERTRFALCQRNLLARISSNCRFWCCIRAHTSAQAKKLGSKKSFNQLTACLLVFQKSRRGFHSRQLRARGHAWETNSSNLPTSSAACASPSDCVFASTPPIFSQRVTTSVANLYCERPCANSIGRSGGIVSSPFTSTIPKPPVVREWIDTNTLAKAELVWTLSASLCVMAVSVRSRKCLKHRRGKTCVKTW